MSEYTPTTEEVRDYYVEGRLQTHDGMEPTNEAQFDRWLDAERKRVWEEARALVIHWEGADAVGPYGGWANE